MGSEDNLPEPSAMAPWLPGHPAWQQVLIMCVGAGRGVSLGAMGAGNQTRVLLELQISAEPPRQPLIKCFYFICIYF